MGMTTPDSTMPIPDDLKAHIEKVRQQWEENERIEPRYGFYSIYEQMGAMV